MATTLTLLNNVLRGLRQDTLDSGTTETSDTFHALLVQFLNEAKREVEDSWDWLSLRTVVTVTGASSKTDHTLTSAGDADTDTDEFSRLLYEKTEFGQYPQVFDVTNSDEYRLMELSPQEYERMVALDDDVTNERPCYFTLAKNSSGEYVFKVYPEPSTARTWKLHMIVPEAELATDSLDSTSVLPARPVWLRALEMATQERGEELGENSVSVGTRADRALDDALIREMTDEDLTGHPQ